MNLNRSWVPTLFLFAAVTSAQTPSKQAPSQDVQKRVSPDAYTAAPATIRAELKRQRCELPETQHWDETRLNIVSGHFGDPAQNDWAAMCIASDGSTHVVVFWGKSAPCPAEIRGGWALRGRFKDGQAGSLYLLAAPSEQILEYRKFFGDAHANSVIHEGIEIGGEETSLIYYCHQGKWLELQGND
jgi:hypothetical protein